MPNYELKFSLSEISANYIAELRGSANADDFFRRAMEIGISQLIESTASTNRDYLMQVQTGAIGDYRMLRGKLFAVGEPQAVPAAQPEALDPMMGLKPRGQPPKA
jgi:hypothetical protein